MYSAKCFLEVNNGVSGKNRIRQGVPVAYDSIAELILCNVKFKSGTRTKRQKLIYVEYVVRTIYSVRQLLYDELPLRSITIANK